jgi:hypothetical protein
MVWSYDADDLIPFPSGNTSGSSGGHTPVTVIASVQQTTHVNHPSWCVLEALEAEAAELGSSAPAQNTSINCKHKAISAYS